MVSKIKTKQEDIGEDVARTFYENSDVSKTIAWLDLPKETKDSFFSKADTLLYRLHSQGVVIKVERELPRMSQDEFDEWCGTHSIKGCGSRVTMCEDYCHRLALIEKVGYVAVEPLIKEE